MSTPAIKDLVVGMAPPRAVPPEPIPFADRFYLLRDALTPEGERPLSEEKVAYRTIAHDPTGRGVSYAAIRKYAKGAPIGSNEDTAAARFADIKRIYVALAGALEVEPEVFPEYRLLLARASLDEAVVGLAQALTTLAVVERAVGRGSRAAADRPKLPSQRSTQTGTPKPRSRRAASG